MSVHGMMNYVLVGVQLNKYHSVNSSCTLCVCVCVFVNGRSSSKENLTTCFNVVR